ncbi:MAG: hypothetical protein B7Y99_05075 [Caulobacterales bacterium 32-69-10]|nr:MAG: hypothetical protein B7Y99_05075 [Caulobacterales bacterium 32-69-10]
MTPVLVLLLALQTAPGDPVSTAPPQPAPAVGASPAPVPAPPVAPATPAPPRKIEDLSRPLTGAVPQGSYESGIRGAFSRTQSLQGPLDGTWVLKDAAGASLYRVQLVDPGFSGGRLEGAWQDLRSGSPMESSGFFSGVAREGARLTLQFARAGEGLTAITVDQRPDGRYAGELKVGDKGEPVVLARP